MRYYLIEVITTTSGTEARNLYGYDDRNKAIQVFHSKMGANMNESTCAKAQMMILNSANGVEKNEIYEVETEEEEDTTEDTVEETTEETTEEE